LGVADLPSQPPGERQTQEEPADGYPRRAIQRRSNQKPEALASAALQGRVRVRVIKGSGSGERLDRKETVRARRAVRSRQFALVLTEDLGRILRRVEAFQFANSPRIMKRASSLSTTTWTPLKMDGRMSAFFAAMRHELYNADNAKRIRRSQEARFESGGMLPCIFSATSNPRMLKTRRGPP